jgi:hypothetical protein
MTRSQRRMHTAVWVVLGPALVAAVVWAWAARPVDGLGAGRDAAARGPR